MYLFGGKCNNTKNFLKMKKVMFLILFAIASNQIVVAESYQRWVYWVSPVNHEVTASEMAEITNLLYDNKIVASEEFALSSGTRLKIPQPSLYLQYIEKAVRAANPAVLSKDDIVFAINDAEKLRWGNDISGSFRNYYYSYVYKGVRSIDNFTGEGRGIDFLFINGIPAIKCDCGNPIENKNPQLVEVEKIVEKEKVVERIVEKESEMIPVDDPTTAVEPQKVEVEITVNQPPYEYWDNDYRYYNQRMTSTGMYVYDAFEYLIYRASRWYRVPYERYISWGGQRIHRQCGYRPHTYNPPHRRPRPSTGGPGGSPRHKDPENGGPGGAGTHGGPGGAITHGGPSGAGMSRSAVTETRRAERSYEVSRNYSRSERAYQGSSYSGSSRSGAFSGYTRTPQRSSSYQRNSNTPSSFGRGGHPAQRSSSRSSGGGSAFRR